ncbi:exonuclease domain-containing protein [Pararhodospirillum oryzae]|uniref:Exonuclease domain-containing protein n=1 Tax=Pararhodospirillum oryzae TaxID=478448 RepID=A0A512H8M2_9PROT|nr:exonuclease domain-containing protein [Pararhodospirillum oryzae]GEO81803.1 hypothetical protein ROR02_19340 [Pararhodospirillum oryzae]
MPPPLPPEAGRDAWEQAHEDALIRAREDDATPPRPPRPLIDACAVRLEPLWRHVFGMDLRRLWLGMRSPRGPLRAYYRAPCPRPATPWPAVEYLALDIEATGLDAETDEILSIGYVPIIEGRVRLAEAGYHLVRPRRPVPEETAVIHGILDGHLENAPRLSQVLPVVLQALAGRVPVAHHAHMERFFLSRACRRLYGQPLEMPFVDTMALEYRQLGGPDQPLAPGSLRLGRIRARRGLPRYPAHNALSDALATAELMLAQADALSRDRPARLAALLS